LSFSRGELVAQEVPALLGSFGPRQRACHGVGLLPQEAHGVARQEHLQRRAWYNVPTE
jgi:hypothetical protein